MKNLLTKYSNLRIYLDKCKTKWTRIIKILLIASLTLGICIFFITSALSKNEYKCNDIKLSEKNYIQKCRLLVNNTGDPNHYVKSMTFCRCIHRNFTVRAWADEKCTYDKKFGYSIMNMANNNMDVEEVCGSLRP